MKTIEFTVFAFCGGCQNKFTSKLEKLADEYADGYEVVSTPTSASGDYTYKIEIEEKNYNEFIANLYKEFSTNAGWKFAEKNPTLVPASVAKPAPTSATTSSTSDTPPPPKSDNCLIV